MLFLRRWVLARTSRWAALGVEKCGGSWGPSHVRSAPTAPTAHGPDKRSVVRGPRPQFQRGANNSTPANMKPSAIQHGIGVRRRGTTEESATEQPPHQASRAIAGPVTDAEMQPTGQSSVVAGSMPSTGQDGERKGDPV